MFVFLHSQHECLNAHNIVSFSAKYAQVTGMWNGVWFFFVVVVCPDSCSLATPHSPIPVVNKGWETVLLKTSSLVPRRQKVALWVYYLYNFFFIHPVDVHVSQVLKRDRLTCLLLPPLLAMESNPFLDLVVICSSCLPKCPFLPLLADSAHWPCSFGVFFLQLAPPPWQYCHLRSWNPILQSTSSIFSTSGTGKGGV